MSDPKDTVWVPEFEGQRPPFEAGNELAVTHGAYSPRKVDPLAREIVAAYMADDDVAFLRQPSYALSVWALARAEARVQLMDEWVSQMSVERSAAPVGKRGAPPIETLRKWEAHAATLRARMGLDPMSRARLGRDVAATKVDVVNALTALREGGTPGGE